MDKVFKSGDVLKAEELNEMVEAITSAEDDIEELKNKPESKVIIVMANSTDLASYRTEVPQGESKVFLIPSDLTGDLHDSAYSIGGDYSGNISRTGHVNERVLVERTESDDYYYRYDFEVKDSDSDYIVRPFFCIGATKTALSNNKTRFYGAYGSLKSLNGASFDTDFNINIYAPTTSGTAGQVLKSNGSGNAPIWANAESGGVTIEEVESKISDHVKTDVPENAVFTDTTYNAFSSDSDGLVPKSNGVTDKYLKSDGTWGTPETSGSGMTPDDVLNMVSFSNSMQPNKTTKHVVTVQKNDESGISVKSDGWYETEIVENADGTTTLKYEDKSVVIPSGGDAVELSEDSSSTSKTATHTVTVTKSDGTEQEASWTDVELEENDDGSTTLNYGENDVTIPPYNRQEALDWIGIKLVTQAEYDSIPDASTDGNLYFIK